jgi:UDP-GlcNAc3NAcA epimerase
MQQKHIVTIIGARPQFIKASALSAAIAEHPGFRETVVHTGQHFDTQMSQVFFEELAMLKPKYNLGINQRTHGAMTGRMLEEIEQILLKEVPDFVVLYGDTNSTLAGALAASKLQIKVVHIEAGLRSYNWKMPEEQNRVLTDRLSDVLFVPSNEAMLNLAKEGVVAPHKHIVEVGDIMYDVFLRYFDEVKNRQLPTSWAVEPGCFALVSMHRQENVDNPDRLRELVDGLNALNTSMPLLFPLHPRTKAALEKWKLTLTCKVIEPLSYLDMLLALQHCRYVLTDSGGLQKEAYYASRMCFTLRSETEWVELVDLNANVLIEYGQRLNTVVLKTDLSKADYTAQPYGEGNSAFKILEVLSQF